MHSNVQHHIDQLNAEAWEVRVSDSVRSGQCSAEAVEKARACGYTRGLATGLRTLGFFYIRQSNHDEAVRCLVEAESLLEIFHDKQGISDVKEYRGIIARNLGDLKASLEFLFESLNLRKETAYHEGESLSLYHLGVTYRYLGNLPRALDYFLESIVVAKAYNNWIAEAYSINNIGSIYFEMGDADNALDYYNRSLEMRQHAGDLWGAAGCYDNIGKTWLKKQDPDKACFFFEEALRMSQSVGDKKGEANASLHLGEAASLHGDTAQARHYWSDCLELRQHIGDKKGQAEVLVFLSDLLDTVDRKPTLEKALQLAEATGTLDTISQVHQKLAAFCKQQGDYAEAYQHLESYQEAERAFHSRGLAQRIANMKMEHDVEQTRKEAEIFRLRNVELAALVEETEKQKHRAEDALLSLQAAQAQLIQSEKMASLGELTAGIAHEIQNPLNFVNNFSELSCELIAEMHAEIDYGDIEEAKAIAENIRQNLEKINHHGKRADAIVKGMLEHSKAGSGKKTLTDINAVCEEYLRLAYHGMKSKDNFFNARIQTYFEQNLPQVEVVSQDIGRVILNLLNNAFYAVNERATCPGQENAADYQPQVTLRTRNLGNRVVISVEDNGKGIPEAIRDKIFQPFFTTKPTGQGTGLGLSLSYDIVTKRHGGSLQMETTEGQGTCLMICLPIASQEHP